MLQRECYQTRQQQSPDWMCWLRREPIGDDMMGIGMRFIIPYLQTSHLPSPTQEGTLRFQGPIPHYAQSAFRTQYSFPFQFDCPVCIYDVQSALTITALWTFQFSPFTLNLTLNLTIRYMGHIPLSILPFHLPVWNTVTQWGVSQRVADDEVPLADEVCVTDEVRVTDEVCLPMDVVSKWGSTRLYGTMRLVRPLVSEVFRDAVDVMPWGVRLVSKWVSPSVMSPWSSLWGLHNLAYTIEPYTIHTELIYMYIYVYIHTLSVDYYTCYLRSRFEVTFYVRLIQVIKPPFYDWLLWTWGYDNRLWLSISGNNL